MVKRKGGKVVETATEEVNEGRVKQRDRKTDEQRVEKIRKKKFVEEMGKKRLNLGALWFEIVIERTLIKGVEKVRQNCLRKRSKKKMVKNVLNSS